MPRTKNSNKANAATRAANKNKNNNGGPPRSGEFTVTVPRHLSIVIPDRFRTTLRGWTSKANDMSSLNYLGHRFRATGAQEYDPTAAVGLVGFKELAALYNSYRVTMSNCKVEVVNTGLVPVTTAVFPSNTDPGASPSGDYVVASRLQPYAVSKTTPLVGGPIVTLTNSMATQKMFGSRMTLYDDNFAALVNTIPVNNWFWVVTLYTPSVTESPVILNFYLEMDIEFYDRVTLSETSP